MLKVNVQLECDHCHHLQQDILTMEPLNSLDSYPLLSFGIKEEDLPMSGILNSAKWCFYNQHLFCGQACKDKFINNFRKKI